MVKYQVGENLGELSGDARRNPNDDKHRVLGRINRSHRPTNWRSNRRQRVGGVKVVRGKPMTREFQ